MDTHKHAHWSDAVATMSHSPQAGSTKNHDIIFSSLLKVFQIIIGKAFPQCFLTIKRNYIVPICSYQTLQIVFSLDKSNLFVWGFMPNQQFFSYLIATVYKAMFPGLFFNQYLTSPLS